MPSIAVSTAYALSFANDRSVGVARARGLGKAWVHKRLRFSFNVEGSGRLTTRSLQKRRSLDIEEDVPGQNGFSIPARSHLLQVAVDIDEVLGSFLISLNAFIVETYRVHYEISEYYAYDFMKIWNCSQAEANSRVHAFFESKHFNSGIVPIPGAYKSLSQLSSYCNLVVVTSRQHVIREPSMEWISTHYKGIFSEIHFGNHFALEGQAKSKSEICKSLGMQFLIDDNPRYAVECAEEGIEVLLFDLDYSYPWSKTPDGPSHPLITRVRNWKEVELKLMARRLSSA